MSQSLRTGKIISTAAIMYQNWKHYKRGDIKLTYNALNQKLMLILIYIIAAVYL